MQLCSVRSRRSCESKMLKQKSSNALYSVEARLLVSTLRESIRGDAAADTDAARRARAAPAKALVEAFIRSWAGSEAVKLASYAAIAGTCLSHHQASLSHWHARRSPTTRSVLSAGWHSICPIAQRHSFRSVCFGCRRYCIERRRKFLNFFRKWESRAIRQT